MLSIHSFGDFYCPDCRRTRRYRINKKIGIRISFKILPVPFVYQEPGIQCMKCGGIFDEIMAESSPARTKEEFNPLIKKVMILMMLADGNIDDEESVCMAEIYEKISGKNLSRQEIDAEVDLIKEKNENLKEYLKRILPYLNPAGKKVIVEAACYIAASDGDIKTEEKAFLKEIVSLLKLPDGYQDIFLEKLCSC